MENESKLLAEIVQLTDQFSEMNDPLIKRQLLTEIKYENKTYPIYSFVIGNPNPTLPTLGLFGGVHGLERVGTQVCAQFLKSLLNQLKWDVTLRESLNHFKIVSIPLINPVGMAHLKRSNGNGVDLMRNAPIEATEIDGRYKIYRGHRISSKLPWYRGVDLETESRALIYFVKQEMFDSKCALAIDFHSGFGIRDRLWYPYAKTKSDFKNKKEALNIASLLSETHPHHIYHIEPQSDSYTTHGDLWDYLYDEFQIYPHAHENVFIPWTLEMGSWIWLKKNPWQIFSREGVFNPLVKHRENRTMRRHFVLIDFFTKLVQNRGAWDPQKK